MLLWFPIFHWLNFNCCCLTCAFKISCVIYDVLNWKHQLGKFSVSISMTDDNINATQPTTRHSNNLTQQNDTLRIFLLTMNINHFTERWLSSFDWILKTYRCRGELNSKCEHFARFVDISTFSTLSWSWKKLVTLSCFRVITCNKFERQSNGQDIFEEKKQANGGKLSPNFFSGLGFWHDFNIWHLMLLTWQFEIMNEIQGSC